MSQTPPVVAVLDDEPQMRKALRRLLNAYGFRVESYQGGVEFLTALPFHPVDCLVLDLHMPGLHGFDVIAALGAQHNTTPVVVVTGHDEPGAAEHTLSLGARAYLRKPVDEMTLLSAIKAAITVHP